MKLLIKVVPKSSKNEVVGIMSGGITKVKIMAAPVDNKVNIALIELFSKKYNTPKSNISIIKGLKSKNKVIEINI